MTDRELLELAAKAAGVEFDAEASVDHMLATVDGKWWKPLTDDGDALRLAVKLGFLVDIGKGLTQCVRSGSWCQGVEHDDDAYAATRRAIVQSAAGIGRMMA